MVVHNVEPEKPRDDSRQSYYISRQNQIGINRERGIERGGERGEERESEREREREKESER